MITNYQKPMIKKRFKIHQVAEYLGLTAQTIRNYEENGTFPKPKLDDKNHWRYYEEDDMTKLKAYFVPVRNRK